MATWITHLRLAENLHTSLPGLEAGPFAVGNIAPDSGVPDANWEKFTPDPTVTHFTASPVAPRIADLEFYNRYLLPLKGKPIDKALLSFRLGYFFHLVTDNLWIALNVKPTREKFAVQLAADKQFMQEIKEDWYAQDFIYVIDHPDCLYWQVFLKVEAYTAGLDFLPLDAVHQRVAFIQEMYQKRDEAVQQQITRPMLYLTTAEMDCFVETATPVLQAVYHHLWVKGLEVDNPFSILDWAMNRI
jgi:hypothetical protein